jgi:hypothetical protein
MAADDTERRLVELGAALAFPPTPSLLEAVVDRLDAPRRRRRHWGTMAAVAAAIVLLVVALPGPRRAVADLLGIGSVRIVSVAELPPVSTLVPFTGDGVSLEAAQSEVEFAIRLPDVGAPDLVLLDPSVPGGLVTLVYEAPDGRPGLVITETIDSVDEALIKKVIEPGVTVLPLAVGVDRGFWIEGPPHLLFLLDAAGEVREDATRLVGDTLLFTRDGVTIRIESALSLDETLDVAASL